MGLLSNIKNKGVIAYNSAKIALGPHKSDICFGLGMGLLAVGIFGLCKASTKIPEKTDDLEKKVNDITRKEQDQEITAEQAKNEIRNAKVETLVEFTKDFGPAGVAVIAGTGLLTKSHFDLKATNAVLASAALAWQNKLNEYRARVVADQGQAKDTYYAYGAKPIVISKDGVDASGNPVHTERVVNKASGDIPTDLSQIRITPDNPYWKNDPGQMLTFIKGRFGELDGRLFIYRKISRNEICDAFGVERDYTAEGLRAGKIYDKNVTGPQFDYTVHWISGDGEAKSEYIPSAGARNNSYIIIELKNLSPDISVIRRPFRGN